MFKVAHLCAALTWSEGFVWGHHKSR